MNFPVMPIQINDIAINSITQISFYALFLTSLKLTASTTGFVFFYQIENMTEFNTGKEFLKIDFFPFAFFCFYRNYDFKEFAEFSSGLAGIEHGAGKIHKNDSRMNDVIECPLFRAAEIKVPCFLNEIKGNFFH